MKTTNRTFGKFLALALVVLFALTAVVPVLAEPAKEGPGNLKVTIHNNEGLPAMSENQFSVYQIFKGTAHKDDTIIPSEDENYDWDAFNWNNYTLADIEWGDSFSDKGVALVKALKALTEETAAWAFAGEEEAKVNVFADITDDAESLAKVLAAHKDNAFLQSFSTYLMDNKEDLELTALTLKPEEGSEKNPVLFNNAEDPKKDTLTFTLPDPGYYLFAETGYDKDALDNAVSEYILAVLGEQDILLKASVPTVDKDIVDGNHRDKGDVAGVSDYVQFKLTGTLPKNFGDFDTYVYAFHDTLSKGLTLVGPDEAHPLTVTVYENQAAADEGTGGVKVNEDNGAVPDGKNYTVTKEGLKDGCSLEVSFADLKTLKNEGTEVPVTKDSVIVVTYWAQVNENAVIGSDGNPNTVQLEYSNDPNHDGTGKTKEKKVYVYAFGLDLIKISSDKAEGLPGAGFVLKNKAGNYAMFKDQWIVTASDGKKTFFDSKEKAEEAAKGDGTVSEQSVRRLTGWTSDSVKPTTKEVDDLIANYENAKKAFDKASNEDRKNSESDAYKALQNAKDALAKYLLESGEDGKIPDVYGLDEGEYTLKEVITPAGYNTMDDYTFSITAEIDENGVLQSVTYTPASGIPIKYDTRDKDTNGDFTARFQSGLLPDKLINQKAPFLPFTGGIGTLIFYVLGTALIVGAITYLVIATKKRKKAE